MQEANRYICSWLTASLPSTDHNAYPTSLFYSITDESHETTIIACDCLKTMAHQEIKPK